MIEFSILKKSKRSRARLGILKTPHGEIETPSLVPVATNATVKGMRTDELAQTKTQILISNTYHLHMHPGEDVLKASGGINKFMQWPQPTMTDSGGFQVFSLGFGRDMGAGKFTNSFPGGEKRVIDEGHQPKSVRITHEGVHFNSPIDGRKLFLGPRESIAIQEAIGADIMFAFDECTPPGVTREYMRAALDRTHDWARECLRVRRVGTARSPRQALYGIVQGSQFKDMRQESARFINALGEGGGAARDGGFDGFEGFAIGGDLGETKTGTQQTLAWTLPLLDEHKPRHLLGIGHIEDMELIIKEGVDTFDCTAPTHYARRGIAFVSKRAPGASRAGASGEKGGRLDFKKTAMLADKGPIDPTCECLVCQTYARNYIAHLIRAREITGGLLLTFHNLFYFNTYVEKIREKIRKGLI